MVAGAGQCDGDRRGGTPPLVSVLAVGGTIAMTGGQGEGVQASLQAQDLVGLLPDIGDRIRVRGRTVAMIPSPHMDMAFVADLAAAVEAEREAGAAGVVITQGTDTLEETAFALELMLGAAAPVVLTGAMRPPDAPGADGAANLRDSIELAASPEVHGTGVTVVMDGTAHAARYVQKLHSASLGAFRSVPVPLGEITEGRVTRLAELPALPPHEDLRRSTGAPVALLTAGLGDDGWLATTLPGLGYAGVVVAAMGGGHLPPAMADRLQEVMESMPVVVAGRTGAGAMLAGTYGFTGGEIDLARRGFVRAGWLPPLKARIALSLLLGAGRGHDGVRDFFAAFDGQRETPGPTQ